MLYFFWVDDCTKDVISAEGSVDLLSDICWHSLLWAEVGFLCKKGSLFSISFSSCLVVVPSSSSRSLLFAMCVMFHGFLATKLWDLLSFWPTKVQFQYGVTRQEFFCCAKIRLCMSLQKLHKVIYYLISTSLSCIFYQKIFAFYSNTNRQAVWVAVDPNSDSVTSTIC